MRVFFDRLSRDAPILIESDRRGVDPFMEIDDFLQFTLFEGLRVPVSLLTATRVEVLAGLGFCY